MYKKELPNQENKKKKRQKRIKVTGKDLFYYALAQAIFLIAPNIPEWLDKREERKRMELEKNTEVEKKRVFWENFIFLIRTIIALGVLSGMIWITLDWMTVNLQSDTSKTIILATIIVFGGLYITTVALSKPLSQTLLSRVISFFKSFFN